MAAFNGKWRLIHGENLEAYHDAIKTPAAFKEKMKEVVSCIKDDPNCHVHEIHIDTAAGVARKSMFFKGEKKHEHEAKLGQENEITTPDGRKIKAKLTLDSPNKITRCEKGDGWEACQVSEVAGDEMTITLTSGSIKAIQKFKKM